MGSKQIYALGQKLVTVWHINLQIFLPKPKVSIFKIRLDTADLKNFVYLTIF